MKPAARRLGRGLGAFLDFGPAGEDGAAFVSEAIEARAPSVLETSATPVAPAAPSPPAPPRAAPPPAPPPPAAARPQSAPVPAPAPAPAPRASAPAAPAAPAIASDEPAFVDDVVFGLTFGDVELE
jgi:hypothetical protein